MPLALRLTEGLGPNAQAVAEARQAALEKAAQRYRKLRNASMDERNRLEHYAGPELDKVLDALPPSGAAQEVHA